MGEGMTGSYAEQIATSVIAALAGNGAPVWAVQGFTAEFQRMYLIDLEKLAPAGGATENMQMVFAPVEESYERPGWGGVRITVTLGVLFNVKVLMANKEITDPKLGDYERLVDQFVTWIMGAWKFGSDDGYQFDARDPVVVKGDHYNDHLYEKEEFHVPVILDFVTDQTLN